MARVARAILAVLMLFGASVAGGSSSASAEYVAVERPLSQLIWARTADASSPPITAVAARPDGLLVVATSPDQRAGRGYEVAGGELHLVADPETVLGPSTRFGPTRFGFSRLVVRKGRLYGLSVTANDVDEIGQKARLIELDLGTGAVLRDLGTWWWPDLALDPSTGELVLYAFDCERRCTGDSEQPGRVTHPLVRFDPDSGRRRTVVADRHDLPSDGASRCGSADGQARCEDPFRVAVAPDGSSIVLASTRGTGDVVEVREPGGTLRRRLSIPRPADTIAVAPSSSCLGDMLVISSFDGSVAGVAGILASGTGVRAIATGAPAGSSAMTVTAGGELVITRRSEVGQLSCPTTPAASVDKAAVAPGPAPQGPVAGGPAPAAAGSGPAPAAPTGPAGGTGGSPPPPPATPSPGVPVAAGPPAHAVQAVTSPVGALADAPEEQPVYGLSASSLPLVSPWWATMAGLLVATGGTWVALGRSPSARSPQIARQDLRS